MNLLTLVRAIAFVALLNGIQLYSMVSFKQAATGNGQQVVTIGDVHTLLENPNIPEKWINSPLSMLVMLLEATPRAIAPLPLIIEGNPDYIKHPNAKLSPVLMALKGLYSRLLLSDDNPLEIHCIDGRGAESDVLNGCIL